MQLDTGIDAMKPNFTVGWIQNGFYKLKFNVVKSSSTDMQTKCSYYAIKVHKSQRNKICN